MVRKKRNKKPNRINNVVIYIVDGRIVDIVDNWV